MDGINDLEYKELRLDLVDLTEGVCTAFRDDAITGS